MSVLSDREIHKLCREGMIQPYEEELLNPASLDVRLGETVMIELAYQTPLKKMDINNYTKDNPFYLIPDEFILAHTVETFDIPDDISAQFALKSSLAREGLEHLMAGWIDPGFNNSVLTLELKNARRYHEIALWPGMKIGQIIFHTMSSVPMESYRVTGRYNNCDSVKASAGIL